MYVAVDKISNLAELVAQEAEITPAEKDCVLNSRSNINFENEL